MATITIKVPKGKEIHTTSFRGIGKVEKTSLNVEGVVILTIPRMSETRFENVVKRVLEKNLRFQGIEPISITYSE